MKKLLGICILLVVAGCGNTPIADVNDIGYSEHAQKMLVPPNWIPCVLGDQVEAEKLILKTEPASFSATNPPLSGTLCVYTKSLSGMPAIWDEGWTIYIVMKRTYIAHKWVLEIDRARVGTEQEDDIAYLVWYAH